MNNSFWYDKKVLITGHTGFKGSWLSIWLHELGAHVIGYSLEPNSNKANYVLSGVGDKIIDIKGDIRDDNKLYSIFKRYEPEIVFHLAAQPLVRLSYECPKETYDINVMGTLNILECIRKTDSTKVGILVTTDKCYDNKEHIWGYRENDPLGGYDPYSSSKACAEILIASYRNSFMNPKDYDKHGKSIASVRAGNVIGGGDWAKDRIVPDCICAIEENSPIFIRNPKAVRPWQHVLEPLSGYMLLAEKLYQDPTKYMGSWNFGPDYNSFSTVWEVAESITREYGSGVLKDRSFSNNLHEASLLFLDITKAKYELGWKPKLNMEKTIKLTVDWYKRYKNNNVYNLCLEQIEEFIDIGKNLY